MYSKQDELFIVKMVVYHNGRLTVKLDCKKGTFLSLVENTKDICIHRPSQDGFEARITK